MLPVRLMEDELHGQKMAVCKGEGETLSKKASANTNIGEDGQK